MVESSRPIHEVPIDTTKLSPRSILEVEGVKQGPGQERALHWRASGLSQRAYAIEQGYLFAGADRSGEHAAAIRSLIGTAQLNRVASEACLRHVLTQIA